jgi:hypothetical protein
MIALSLTSSHKKREFSQRVTFLALSIKEEGQSEEAGMTDQ